MTAVKVVRFLDGGPSLPAVLRGRWSRALATGVGDPPPAGRPLRVAVAEPLRLPDFPPPPFAAADLQWFGGAAEALANEAWLAATGQGLGFGSPGIGPSSCRVVAEEVVARGGDYLRTRWAVGGERFTMMSFGRRAPGISRGQFSARWRGHAGRLGAEDIPEEVRGLAYVQDHPLELGHDWPFDAVNQAYFERLEGLRRRRDWFAARQAAALRSGDGGLMSPTEAWAMFVREWPLTPPEGSASPSK
jgi:hypothetical protein